MNYSKPGNFQKDTALISYPKIALTPRQNTFSLDLILRQNPESKSRKFKFLFNPENPTHRRQPSVIIKNITDIYSFEQDSFSDESIDEELSASPKTSITRVDTGSVLTLFQKSSTSSEKLENESSNMADLINGTTKPDELDDLEDLDFGLFPCLMYCQSCKEQVMTSVNIKLPTLPFWKTACCLSSFFDLSKSAEKFQEFEHVCVKCRTVLAVKSPNN